MKRIDPLMIITAVVSLGLLAVMARYVITGTLEKDVLSILSTLLGGLVTALSTRRKDKGDGDDGPQ